MDRSTDLNHCKKNWRKEVMEQSAGFGGITGSNYAKQNIGMETAWTEVADLNTARTIFRIVGGTTFCFSYRWNVT